ncbi:hypothetical protein J2S05_002650 [Alkalicoccobacillus murimartini]|uniref:Uncharacterized protein n=1 Tax=Alkalicoccobacillus murimartini TaxID=171685 RepID=A0ABT9YJI1_9BACI|nr:hypothetical protein [Alkalicoccobacillus murimartini]
MKKRLSNKALFIIIASVAFVYGISYWFITGDAVIQ